MRQPNNPNWTQSSRLPAAGCDPPYTLYITSTLDITRIMPRTRRTLTKVCETFHSYYKISNQSIDMLHLYNKGIQDFYFQRLYIPKDRNRIYSYTDKSWCSPSAACWIELRGLAYSPALCARLRCHAWCRPIPGLLSEAPVSPVESCTQSPWRSCGNESQ